MISTPESVVAQTFGRDVAEVTDESSPDSIVEWDSLGHITLIIELESQYGISFAPDEAIGLTTVGAIKGALSTRGIAW